MAKLIKAAVVKSAKEQAREAGLTIQAAVRKAMRAGKKDKESVAEFLVNEFGIELTPVQAGVAVYQVGMLKRKAKAAKELAGLDSKTLAKRVKAMVEEARLLGYRVVKRKTWAVEVAGE